MIVSHWMGFIFRTEPACYAVTLKAKFIFRTPYYSVVSARELKEIGISLQPSSRSSSNSSSRQAEEPVERRHYNQLQQD
jgi:hypothetical protein